MELLLVGIGYVDQCVIKVAELKRLGIEPYCALSVQQDQEGVEAGD